MWTTANAQTTLFSESFNSGNNGGFTLNTSDVSSQAAGDNDWIVNNSYAGGSSAGSCVLMGFPLPFDFSFTNTPQQPAGISNANGHFLHISSPKARTATPPILGPGYFGPDGYCINAGNYFFKMSSDISTIGYNTVNLSFWWIGTGTQTSFVEIYYSTNGGSSWTLVTSPTDKYYRQETWTQANVSMPEFANQATLRFGFRLTNPSNVVVWNDVTDVGYGFDDFLITGTGGTPVDATIATGAISPTSFCAGQSVNVPFTSTGVFNAGNVYTAQLSDASGSFASPVNIGTLTSTGNSGTINAQIPGGATSGNGYKIRVISSNPAVEGTASSATISITEGNTVIPITTDPANTTTLCAGDVTLSIPAGYSNVVWTPGGSTNNSIIVSSPGTYSVSGTIGGCDAQSVPVTISAAEPPTPSFTFEQVEGYLVQFTNTSTNGSSYEWRFGAFGSSTAESPSFSFPFDGTYSVKLIVTNDCGKDSIVVDVLVEKTSIINDLEAKLNFNLFPNPANQTLFYSMETLGHSSFTVEVFNSVGALVYTENFNATGKENRSLNLSGYAPGIYSLRLTNSEGAVNRRFVKQ